MDREPQGDPDRIRVSDRERERIVELLGAAAAEGRLTLDEYAERAAAAHHAKTRGELVRLTDDLPGELASSDLLPSPAARPVSPPTPVEGAAPERLFAVFGTDSRTGNWPVPARLEARAVFGEIHIELQNARLQHPVTVIEVTAVFGSVTIYVPEGVEVRLLGNAVFGTKETKLGGGPPAPGAPVLEVRARVVFGTVAVRPPKRRRW